jgi:hypothetical protein
VAWTKREFVVQAFSEIGLASYVYDLQPEQLQTALNRLDSMLATWNGLSSPGRGERGHLPEPRAAHRLVCRQDAVG